MKILLIDIETAPNAAWVWGLWNQNIGINQIVNSGYVLCWAAKWYNDKKIMFSSLQEDTPKTMLRKIHALLDEADVVVHYNGAKFDIPTLNKEFVIYGIKPPAPFKQIDLYSVVKNRFRFPSNKLDFVAQALGLGQKIRHKGFELWIECMKNAPSAWKDMKKYNLQDVILLEALYVKVLPWIKNHPHYGLYRENEFLCTNCGSRNYHKRGWAYTTALKYQRFQCNDCGTWFRGNKSKLVREEKFVGVH